MKTHFHNFMIGHFKRTFQTVYIDAIYCFLYIDMYIWRYLYRNIYGVKYSRNSTNQTEKNPGLLIISSLILSNLHLYEKTGN